MSRKKNHEKIKKKSKKMKIFPKKQKIDTKHENLKIKKHWAQQNIFFKKKVEKFY